MSSNLLYVAENGIRLKQTCSYQTTRIRPR